MRIPGGWRLIVTAGVLGLAVVAAGVAWYLNAQVGPLEPEPEVEAVAAEIVHEDTPAGETVTLVPERPNGVLVVFAHGNNQTARAIYAGAGNPGVSVALLDAGYTVAASDAYGDNWGSAEGVAAYVDLVKAERARYGLDQVFVISESMGSLAALQLAGQIDAAGWVGYYPVCDLSSVLDQDDIAADVKEAEPDVAALSPVAVPKGLPVAMWVSHDDTRVPPERNAQVCKEEATGLAKLTWTSGDHGDPSNFDPDAVVAFFDRLH